MTTAQADPMIGRLVDGRYQVRSRIARGGMATVYLATDLRLERRVAIKIMHGHLADDNTFKSRFVQEARSAARLAHPNVVNVFDQGQDDDMAYLVMEYLPGITLRELLKDYKRLTAEQTVDILDAVLAGLAAAHRAGIIHRDVKPENVLLADDGRIKLSDFGLARAATQNTATGQALLGTIAYLSPELVTRGVADARSDVYALGIMLYEMLTGEQPFVGEAPMQIAYQHANDQVPPPSSRVPSVPAELDELVVWATRRNPDERPEHAGILLERLREVEASIRSGRATATGAQPTLVLGDLAVAPTASATAETAVLGTRRAAKGPTPALLPDETTPETVARLQRGAARRRRRGHWWLAVVLVLAAVAGGTGWYFGAGPGGYVAVGDVRTLEPAAAKAALTAQGFEVADGERHDLEVPEGQVAATDPAAGTLVRRGETVRLLVSLGPRMLPLPAVVGASVDDARAQLGDFTVDDAVDERFDDAAPGSVLAVLDADGGAIEAETQIPEQSGLSLVVSLGPVPAVWNLPVAEAEQRLRDAGLEVGVNDGEYDDSGEVPEGNVLRSGTDADPIRKGETIWITPSLGIQLVDVPDVTGQKVDAAVDALKAAGFETEVSFPEPFWGLPTVTGQDPAGAARVEPGSTIRLVAQLTL